MSPIEVNEKLIPQLLDSSSFLLATAMGRRFFDYKNKLHRKDSSLPILLSVVVFSAIRGKCVDLKRFTSYNVTNNNIGGCYVKKRSLYKIYRRKIYIAH